ncbi:hypothetical protein H8356DRAFT_1012241 [Neocallimastix lanati (nom. inval.)]|nr:hypothetical protein H8356DRAFT_1012241 [Neocallimastix sp. JGI-2020a]
MNYFGKSSFQKNSWSKNRSGQWVNSCSIISSRNAPVVRKMQRQAPVKKQPIKQVQQAPVKKQPVKQLSKQSEANLIREFNNICQCFDGMNYFGKSSFQKNSWSKNRLGQWVNSCSIISSRNAPVVRKMQRQAPVKKQPIKQVQQAPVKKQPVKQLSKQSEANLIREFNNICQCFDGMNYFGKSSFQKNSWSKNRLGQWVNSCSIISSRNAPVVRKMQRQAPVKKQPIKQVQQAPVKKQSVQQRKMKMQNHSMKPIINSSITKEQQQMNQKCIVAQQNASMKLKNKILKQFREKQEQLEKKKKIEEQQKIKRQQQMKIQQKNTERKLKQQSIKQTVKQPSSIKKQQMQKEKIRVQKALKNNERTNVSKRNTRRQSDMTRSQEKKIRKKQNLIRAINKRISELNAEKNENKIFNKMVKQKTEHILRQKQKIEMQNKISVAKEQSQSKLREKEAYDNQQKRIQRKLAKQKKQIRNKVNQNSSLEAQKKRQLAELKNKLTPEQYSKIQNIMQQKGNQSKEQNARQLQSEQAKKSWQEQVKKMKARQQDIQQKQQKQNLVKRRFESIKRKLTPKQQENLMKQLKMKEQQKKDEFKNHQPRANNNKRFVKKQNIQKQITKQQPIRQMKQSINKKQMTKKTEIWTFVSNKKNTKTQMPVQKQIKKTVQKQVQQKANKGTKSTINTRPMNSSEIKIFNNEFADLCNMFEISKYLTYSNYKTWSKNKSGKYVSNASVIAARNAPRMTRGLSKQMNFSKNNTKKTQNAKPQQKLRFLQKYFSFSHIFARRNCIKMPKQVKEIKDFLIIARRKDAQSVKIKKNNRQTKFKVRCSKYLYTLVVNDQSKVKKLRQSLPPGNLLKFKYNCILKVNYYLYYINFFY